MLTIRHTRVFRGPNIWAPVPVIVLEVAIGELEERLRRRPPSSSSASSRSCRPCEASSRYVGQPGCRLSTPPLAPISPRPGSSGLGPRRRSPATTRLPRRGRYTVVYHTSMRMWEWRPATLAVRLLNHLLGKGEPDFDFAHELAKLIRRHASNWPMTGRRHRGGCRRAAGIPVRELLSKSPGRAARQWMSPTAIFWDRSPQRRPLRQPNRERQGPDQQVLREAGCRFRATRRGHPDDAACRLPAHRLSGCPEAPLTPARVGGDRRSP